MSKNNNNKPLISIIMPSYNSQEHLLETIKTINDQTYLNWELLITDDCSNDHTFDMLKKVESENTKIQIFKNESNSGAAISRNNSLAQAQGDFIAFIDSDDLWDKDKLEHQVKFMGDDIDFSFTAYNLIDVNSSPLGKTVDLNNKGPFTYRDMLKKKATLGCSTVLLRKNAFSDISMPLLRTGQDYATWLKLLKTGKKAYLLNETLTSYRILPNSISRNKFKKAKRQWQIYRKIESLSLFYSIYCFLFYAYRAVFRQS